MVGDRMSHTRYIELDIEDGFMSRTALGRQRGFIEVYVEDESHPKGGITLLMSEKDVLNATGLFRDGYPGLNQ